MKPGPITRKRIERTIEFLKDSLYKYGICAAFYEANEVVLPKWIKAKFPPYRFHGSRMMQPIYCWPLTESGKKQRIKFLKNLLK